MPALTSYIRPYMAQWLFSNDTFIYGLGYQRDLPWISCSFNMLGCDLYTAIYSELPRNNLHWTRHKTFIRHVSARALAGAFWSRGFFNFELHNARITSRHCYGLVVQFKSVMYATFGRAFSTIHSTHAFKIKQDNMLGFASHLVLPFFFLNSFFVGCLKSVRTNSWRNNHRT